MPGVSDFKISGLLCAPCTPFNPDGELNLEIIPKYIDHLLEYEVPSVFITGSVGEGYHLTLDERKRVAETWVQAGKGKLRHIIVHISGNNYKESQELAKHAQDIGADAIGCMAPSYFKPETAESYAEYMAKVASAAPNLPFFLYDIDFMTGCKFSGAEFFRAARDRIPTLVGVKHTSPNFPSMHRILAETNNKFQVVLGSDEIYIEGLTLGIESSVMSSYLGRHLNRIRAAFNKGDMETARREQAAVLRVTGVRDQFGLSGPGGTKLFLRAMGLEVGDPRIPLAPIPQETVDQLKANLEAAGFGEYVNKYS